MANGITSYGQLSAEHSGRWAKQMLRVGQNKLLLETSITVTEDQPEQETKIVDWVRYKALPEATTVAVTEGITPNAVKLESEIISATLDQYIGLIQTTDVLHYFHPHFKTSIATKRLGEQAAKLLERLRFNTFKAATTVYYANGNVRSAVNTVLTQALLRKGERLLVRNLAEEFTDMVNSTPDYKSESILPAYWAYCHPDLRYDIMAIAGFIDVKDYGHTINKMDGELGSIGNIRFLLSTMFSPYADGGGAKGSMITTTGTSADVYPILIAGRDAWGGVSFKGKNAIHPFLVTPSNTAADPAAQRGFVGYKFFTKNKILNDDWCVVLEVACTEL